MTKAKIIDCLTTKLKNELNQITLIAEQSQITATHSDMKAESKYDTRATEASYLAGAQAKRVYEIIRELDDLENLDPNEDHQKIKVGSLMELELNGRSNNYFISPASGGFIAQVETNNFMVIGIHSPIAQGAIGLEVNDSFEVETPKEIREYTIKSII